MALPKIAPPPEVPTTAVPSSPGGSPALTAGILAGGDGTASSRAADGCWRRRGRWRPWGQWGGGWRRERGGGDSRNWEGKIGKASALAARPRETCWCVTEAGTPAGSTSSEPWFRLSAGRRPWFCRQGCSQILASGGVFQDRTASEERRSFRGIGSTSGTERGSSIGPCSLNSKGRGRGEGKGGSEGEEGGEGSKNEAQTTSGLLSSASRPRGSTGHQLKPYVGSIRSHQLILLVVCAWLRRILAAIALYTEAHSCHRDTLPGQVAASFDSTLSSSSHSTEAASSIQNRSGGTAWKRHFQQRSHHERSLPSGPAERGYDGTLERARWQLSHSSGLLLPLLRLPRRGPHTRRRPEHVHLPRASETHVCCCRRAQLPAAVQSSCGRSVCDKDRALLPRQRVLQPLLGLGRRGRRYGLPRSTGRPRDNSSSGVDCKVHNDQTHQEETIGVEGTQQTAKDLRKTVSLGRSQHGRFQALSHIGTSSVHAHPGRRRVSSSQHQGYTGSSRRPSNNASIHHNVSAARAICREILILNGGHVRPNSPARDLENHGLGEPDRALKFLVNRESSRFQKALHGLVFSKFFDEDQFLLPFMSL